MKINYQDWIRLSNSIKKADEKARGNQFEIDSLKKRVFKLSK